MPCGKCLPCKVHKRSVWASRILQEWITCSYPCWFLTFTYSDAKLPVTVDHVPTLRKRAFRNWIRKTYDVTGGFRYYAVGEYGPTTMRPHYHMALFPRDLSGPQQVTARWTKGFTTASELNATRARYLAEYCVKGLTKDTDERLERYQEPEFRVSSKNPPLGAALVPALVARYSTPQGRTLLEDRGDIERTIRIGGRIYPLGPWLTGKVREKLSIPSLARDRFRHQGYEDHNLHKEYATWDPIEADKLDLKINAQTTQKKLSKPYQRI